MLPASLPDFPWDIDPSWSVHHAPPQMCLRIVDGSLPFGVWVSDCEGGVRYVSPSFLETVGMSLEQCRAEGWAACLAAEDAEATVAKWRRCLREKRAWDHEFRIRGRDGCFRHVLSRGAPVTDSQGCAKAWMGVNLDVTELKRADAFVRGQDERRRIAQRLEVIGRLAGGVAHDFNNLLTAVNGYAELLLAMPGLEAGTAGYAREILKAGEKAAQLTRQLLAFSRRQLVATRVLDLNVLLRDLGANLAQLLRGSAVEVAVVPGAAYARVKADPAQVEQILLNLAFNARDAMPRGGRLTLETANAELRSVGDEAGEAAPGSYVALSVRDTGMGMDDDALAHLFEPFYTTKGKSQGLGLSAVYGIVKQNCGHIIVSSRRGEGTEVRIYWPLWIDDAAGKAGARSEASPLVLVAEDDESMRGLVRAVLEDRGYRVVTAASAPEAMDISKRTEAPIDLLLADVGMPGVDGVALAGAMRTSRPGMKILFMTAHLDQQPVRHEVPAAEGAFIGKPFSPGELLAKVRDLLEAGVPA